jgi:hypothetical protein
MDIAKLLADKITVILFLIAIGALVTLVVNGIFIINNEHYRNALEFNVLLFEFVITSSPFLVFAFLGITVREPWIYGIILTVVFQGCLVYDRLTREDSNIGLGMLLIASPIIIVAVGLLTMRSRARTPQDSGHD